MKVRNWSEIRGARDEERVAREKVEAIAEVAAHQLGDLRGLRQLTQSHVAGLLNMTQPGVSRIEHQGDSVQLATLRRYIEALGGHLEVFAVFGDEELPVRLRVDDEEAETVGAV